MMLIKLLLITGFEVAASASTLPHHPELFSCGAPTMNEEQKAVTKQMAIQEALPNRRARAQITPIVVETYMHVVATNKTEAGGYVSSDALIEQMRVLNRNFDQSDISFTLKDIDWTIDANWSENRDDMVMKTKLRKGSYSALNLYYLNSISDHLGVCDYPVKAMPGSVEFFRDGCSILHTTVPGGSATNYNEGKTTTHEVGHWFGLIHTFGQFGNGCYGDGDYVDDTPAQKTSSKGCPTGRDSCPDLPGLDPIHNYMDYSYDACYEEFTAGQKSRMLSMWNNYRYGN